MKVDNWEAYVKGKTEEVTYDGEKHAISYQQLQALPDGFTIKATGEKRVDSVGKHEVTYTIYDAKGNAVYTFKSVLNIKEAQGGSGEGQGGSGTGEGGQGQGGSTEVSGNYVEVGTTKVQLVEQTGGTLANLVAQYKAEATVAAGDKIKFYENDTLLTDNIGPNGDDAAGNKQNNVVKITDWNAWREAGNGEFEIQAAGSVEIWFQVWAPETDGGANGHSFWISGGPAINGGEGEGGEGQQTNAKYGYKVNGGNVVDLEALTDKDYQGRDQFKATITLAAGDTLVVHDNDNNVDFVSFDIENGGASSSFTKGDDVITCNVAGTYDFYFKFKWEDNKIWVQAHSE